VLEVAQDVSVAVLVEVLCAAILAKVVKGRTDTPPQQVRLRITRTHTDGTSVVHELAGTAEDIQKLAEKIDNAS